jgi:hypothetical protein
VGDRGIQVAPPPAYSTCSEQGSLARTDTVTWGLTEPYLKLQLLLLRPGILAAISFQLFIPSTVTRDRSASSSCGRTRDAGGYQMPCAAKRLPSAAGAARRLHKGVIYVLKAVAHLRAPREPASPELQLRCWAASCIRRGGLCMVLAGRCRHDEGLRVAHGSSRPTVPLLQCGFRCDKQGRGLRMHRQLGRWKESAMQGKRWLAGCRARFDRAPERLQFLTVEPTCACAMRHPVTPARQSSAVHRQNAHSTPYAYSAAFCALAGHAKHSAGNC